MSSTDTILVLLDAKARHHAGLAKAAILAQKYRTRLELISGGGNARWPALQSLAQPLREGGLEVTTTTVCADDLNDALAVRLTDASTRFVIKDVVHNVSSPRAELTSTDWQLARVCPVPLLLSKPTLWSEVPVICAAIDSRHEDDERACLNGSILVQGAMLAKRMDGDLHVLHTPADARLRGSPGYTCGYQVPASHVHLLIGSLGEALSGCASRLGASIVVLGAMSRAALCADSIGSTRGRLLEQILCDVLIVKGSHAAITIH